MRNAVLSPHKIRKWEHLSMSRLLDQIFLEHPRSVNEGYFEHSKFALGFSLKLFSAAFFALVHAVIPCLFQRNASKAVQDLNKVLDAR